LISNGHPDARGHVAQYEYEWRAAPLSLPLQPLTIAGTGISIGDGSLDLFGSANVTVNAPITSTGELHQHRRRQQCEPHSCGYAGHEHQRNFDLPVPPAVISIKASNAPALNTHSLGFGERRQTSPWRTPANSIANVSGSVASLSLTDAAALTVISLSSHRSRGHIIDGHSGGRDHGPRPNQQRRSGHLGGRRHIDRRPPSPPPGQTVDAGTRHGEQRD